MEIYNHMFKSTISMVEAGYINITTRCRSNHEINQYYCKLDAMLID